MKREKSCGAIIFRKDGKVKYLLLHYETGHWDFAKGHVEKGESEEDTVRREVREETGIADLRFVGGFKEIISYFFKEEKGLVLKEVVYLLAETKTANIKLSQEHKGYKWLEYEKAVETATFKTAKDLLNKANDFLKKASRQKKIGDYRGLC